MRKSVQLWEKHTGTGTGTGYGWIHDHGQFPGNNTGLQVIAGSGDLLAMWLIARIDMTKQDHDRNSSAPARHTWTATYR